MKLSWALFAVSTCFFVTVDSGKHSGQTSTLASSSHSHTWLQAGNTHGRQALQNANNLAAYAKRELLLRQMVAECSKGQDTVLELSRSNHAQVLPDLDPQAPCPTIDIALRAKERGVGMCTDAVLYVVYAGARIIPLLPPAQMQYYNRKCGNVTARMFLETMYQDWLLPQESALHLMQVNSEHLFLEHAHLHPHMHIFLCKTRFCQRLMKQYRDNKKFNSKVWYVGHTSSDVLVQSRHAEVPVTDTEALQKQHHWQRPYETGGRHLSDAFPGSIKMKGKARRHRLAMSNEDMQQTVADSVNTSSTHQRATGANSRLSFELAADYSQFLHVKGKSGLKHTEKILQCWTGRPDLPLLTVIGQHSLDEPHIKPALRSNNVLLLPPPTQPQRNTTQQRQLMSEALTQKQALGKLAESLSFAVKQQLPHAQKQHAADPDSTQDTTTTEFEASEALGQSSLPKGFKAEDIPHLSSLVSLEPGALLTFEDIRFLQTSIGIHLCPSEREGFGHYLNEARAAGALVITTDHPPMNELITQNSGHLVKPVRVESYADIMALAPYGEINAFLEAEDICKAVDQVLKLTTAERAAKGLQARRQYVMGRSHFTHKMQRLVRVLTMHASRNVLQGHGS